MVGITTVYVTLSYMYYLTTFSTMQRDFLSRIYYYFIFFVLCYTGELGYDGPLYDKFLHMKDDMLRPTPMDVKYMSYLYNVFSI